MMNSVVRAADGHTIGYQVRPPSGDTDGATTVVFLPALGVPLSYYARLFDVWAAAGRRVVGVEHRGQPMSPIAGIRRGRFGYSDIIRTDLPAVFALPEVSDSERVVLIGHSMGGALALLSTAAGTVAPDAVVTIATGTSWCSAEFGARRRVQRYAGIRVVRTVTRTLGYWPGHRLGFGGRQPSTVMRDWAYEASHGRFRLHGDAFDYESALSELKTPRLMLDIEGDDLINPRAVALLAKRAAKAERMRVNSADGVRVNHFTWARRMPAEVAAPIDEWLAML
ncbi:alpha/beta fold hydrolase [Actinoplanes sp. LDG1-06]|uniref:Alpha/beta fold hydrolase n=1 Tax=Paractinoplanes ovalisporus TaxID=2810368 RepID=A0ABS2A3B0_9ACTN|nr:alpha/beta fold hydrolase [Actinoplanes ovalisporus]MBM2614323.1 alpha/beta fold hydrolase [Actinoplanes ovalisporus]